MTMRIGLVSAVLATLLVPHALSAGEPAPLKDLMVKVVEPMSNAIFYISRDTPNTDDEWKIFQGKALVMIEVANLLMQPDRYQALRGKNKAQWTHDAKELLDASQKAYAAANAKNVDALGDLNDPLYTACTTCHEHFMPKR